MCNTETATIQELIPPTLAELILPNRRREKTVVSQIAIRLGVDRLLLFGIELFIVEMKIKPINAARF